MNDGTPLIEEEASKSLQQVWFVLQEQRNILIGGLVFGILLAGIIFLVQPSVYESRSQFIIDDLPFKLSSAKGADGSVSQFLVQSLIKSIPSTEMQTYVADKLNVPQKNVVFIDLNIPLSLRLAKQANIRVENPRESRTGIVYAEASSPEFAADVVNAVTEKFSQINYLAGHINDLDLKINYNRDQVSKLGEQLATASGERIRYQQQTQTLEAYLHSGQRIENYPVFANDVTLNNLKTRYVQVKSEYESLASYSIRGNKLEGARAELQDLETQIEEYSNALGQSLHASYQIALDQETLLQRAVNEAQQQINQYENEMAQYIAAIGDLKLRKKLGLAGENQTDLKQASVVVVVENGQPIKRRKSPRGSICLAIGLTLGLGFGLSGAFLVHALDRRVKLPSQIEALSPSRCLAVLTKAVETKDQVHVSEVPRGLYYLRSQLLRAAITGNKDRIFSFTPAGHDEDVVKIVAQLAILLAETEKKTLVVDISFHSPRMCQELGVESKGGLNQWLNSEEELSSFITVTAISELAVLDSIKTQDVAEDLISRRPLISSLEAMKNSWDFILIASPPLLESAYLLFAAPLGSPVIAVADYEASSLDDLNELHDYCAIEGLKFQGVVLNNYPQAKILNREMIFGMGGHRYLFEKPDVPRGEA